ncbi:putative bifunctional diguanylate cyclase/phosphodiesterase [Janthinobacterium sp. HLX7-2]|uniref:putative bifunctional diguanylate cyclase/phosphodiesterase n=1 Tax=Janthinobacterium sp. HLX7-2 TaxID=1259331 RepID=UPI003F2938C8
MQGYFADGELTILSEFTKHLRVGPSNLHLAYACPATLSHLQQMRSALRAEASAGHFCYCCVPPGAQWRRDAAPEPPTPSMTAPQRTKNEHFFQQWLIHAMVLFALAGFIGFTQYEEYHRIDTQEHERLTMQAEIVEKNLTPQLNLTKQVIDSVIDELAAWQAQGDHLRQVNHSLKVINNALIGIRPILVIGPDGRLVAGSDASMSSDNFHQNDCFQKAMRLADPQLLHLSAPPGNTAVPAAITLCRRISGFQGSFGGIVMVSLAPAYFSDLLDSVRYARDVVSSISREDGQLYMVSSRQSGAGTPGPLTGMAPGTGKKRMVAERLVPSGAATFGTTLRIAVSRDTEVLFAPWRHSLYVQSVLFGLVAVLSTLGLLIIQKRHRLRRVERKKTEKQIQQLAFFDQLTKLPNRILLLDRLKQAMKSSLRSGNHGAVLFIDLDNFKTLNDTLGHDMGDLLLNQVARRLVLCVRAGDTVARLGGDEFVVMLTDLHMNAEHAAAQVDIVGNKIRKELSQTYRLNQLTHRSTSSIGATLFMGNLTSIDDLLKQADLAMYKSKAVGRNALRFFDPAMEVAMLERAALETDLRDAVPCRQLILHYQPQIDHTGRVTGVEALVRWQHPIRGLVPPGDFIPLAEEIGVILPLGQWVLETACTQLLAWAGRPDMRHLSIAVNVSVRQFNQEDFVDQVLFALASSGADPRRLKLELTESLLVSDVDGVIAKMSSLKAHGVGFSLDDFGTGYSSLAYLKRLPLDQLKIDKSFVRDVIHDPSDASIAKTIIALARSLNIAVIAEGVETLAQRDFLARYGCRAYQGYFFSRPLTLPDLEAFVQRRCAATATAPS